DRIELPADEIRFGGTGAMEPQRDVRLPALEVAHGVGGDQIDPDPWVLQTQLADERRKQQGADHLRRGDPHDSFQRLRTSAGGQGEIVGAMAHRAHVPEQGHAAGRQLQPAPATLEQRDAQLLLQRRYLSTQRGLRHPERPRCPRERAFLGGDEECPRPVPVESDRAPIHADLHTRAVRIGILAEGPRHYPSTMTGPSDGGAGPPSGHPGASLRRFCQAFLPTRTRRMAFPGMTAPKLDDLPIGVRPRLAALWTGLMFCFIYADILGLYDPWLIGEILKGNMGPVGPITQELKFAVAMLMSIPAIMVFLSVVLERRPNRWANIIAAMLFAVATCITLFMDPWA